MEFLSLRKLCRLKEMFVIRRWVRLFDPYLKASGKIKEKKDVQCAILLYVIGEEEAMEIYNNLQFANEEDRVKLDVLKSKFWQAPLDDESFNLCTFNTPYGCYRFKQVPFGITSAPEVYQKKKESLFGDIEGVEVIFDDLIVVAADKQEHDQIMLQLLLRAQEANVKLNSAKLQYKVNEVT